MNSIYILSGLGVIALLSEIFNFRKALLPMILVGLVAAIGALAMDWSGSEITPLFNNMLVFDRYAISFSVLLCTLVFLWILLAKDFLEQGHNFVDKTALILFALVGGVLLTCYNNLVMLFLGIEIISISFYVLAGSNKSDLFSNEAAIKYFLMGAFATGILLFGIALMYGATGTFHLTDIADKIKGSDGAVSPLFITGVVLILIGLAFKVSGAPFHFWAPDVYQGSPTIITAIMATLVKAAAFAGFFRVFYISFNEVIGNWFPVLWIITVLTLVLSNISALVQTNAKRILAYSGIAHAGFMLMGILAMNKYSSSALLYYAIAYSFASLTSFGVLYIVSEKKQNDSVSAFNGLFSTNPFLGFVMLVALLSSAGIPPMAGFFAKYYIFVAALKNEYLWIVLIALVSSLIGVYYYFKMVIAMVNHKAEGDTIEVTMSQKAALILLTIGTLLLGLFPGIITRLL